ncbi:hypothetical protein E4U55_002172 [Claviceps digitariae]|nr:hypothetical protein E4U55_002172 [Claviceps digitariae]
MQFSNSALAVVAIFAGQALSGCTPITPTADYYRSNVTECVPAQHDDDQTWMCHDPRAFVGGKLGQFQVQTEAVDVIVGAACRGSQPERITEVYCDAESWGTILLDCPPEHPMYVVTETYRHMDESNLETIPPSQPASA